MPSLEYRLVWHARGGSGIVSVWRPVAPPGYAPLGDVATLGREPPTQPVQVRAPCPRAPGPALQRQARRCLGSRAHPALSAAAAAEAAPASDGVRAPPELFRRCQPLTMRGC